jgi:hypothetical protein
MFRKVKRLIDQYDTQLRFGIGLLSIASHLSGALFLLVKELSK